jgi:Luciferase-like monooxygenase
MDFGIALPTAADSWKVTKEAEELGFTHAWFYDTQMLSADCFVAMGAAAVNTKRIRLGTGVLVPSNRNCPGCRQCAGDAEPARTGPHRLRRRHGLHRAAGDGLWRHQGKGHGDLHPSGLRPARP